MHKQLILGKRMIITMLCIGLTFMGAVPTFAADKMIILFYSLKISVATIRSKTGELEAVAPGTVKIIAKDPKTGIIVATKIFKVLQRAESITADVSELYLNGGETARIKATKTPSLKITVH